MKITAGEARAALELVQSFLEQSAEDMGFEDIQELCEDFESELDGNVFDDIDNLISDIFNQQEATQSAGQ